jgi:hypothetical protein
MNTDNLLTPDEAIAEIGCSKQTFWRALKRAGRDEIVVYLFNKMLIRKDRLNRIRQHYYQHGSEAAHRVAVESGRAGGTQKGVNARKRAGGRGKAGSKA